MADDMDKGYEEDALPVYDKPNGQCKVCHQPITIAIFKGGLWCSDEHRKIYVGEKQAGLR